KADKAASHIEAAAKLAERFLADLGLEMEPVADDRVRELPLRLEGVVMLHRLLLRRQELGEAEVEDGADIRAAKIVDHAGLVPEQRLRSPGLRLQVELLVGLQGVPGLGAPMGMHVD